MFGDFQCKSLVAIAKMLQLIHHHQINIVPISFYIVFQLLYIDFEGVNTLDQFARLNFIVIFTEVLLQITS
jgi:hypothetical protein